MKRSGMVKILVILFLLIFAAVLLLNQNKNTNPLIYHPLLQFTNTPSNQPISIKADEIWGDETFTNTSSYSNIEIILNGNLTIASGGSLTLTNVTLIVNCTANGEHRIEVQSGGALYINDTDGNPDTVNDATNITAYNPSYKFLFWVKSGATFHMNNSELYYCGSGPYTPNLDQLGLWINTNNTVIENNTLTNNYYGIVLYDAHHNKIRSNNATNNYYGFYLSYSSFNTLEDNAATSTYDGFYLIYSSYNTLINNNATNNGYRGFILSASLNNNLTDNNAIDNGDQGFYLSTNSNETSLNDNNAMNNGKDGFYLSQNSYNTFIGNNATNNHDNGFYFYYSSYNNLTNNEATNNTWENGFYLYYSSDNNLTGNNATANYKDGFLVSEYNILTNNIAIKNQENGFHLGVSDMTISDNYAINNSLNGFYLDYSHNNTVMGNYAINNTDAGFYLDYWSSENNITGNIATGNNIGFGLYDHSYNNTITNNEATNNYIGFNLNSSSYNTLAGNNATKNDEYGFRLHVSSNNNILTGNNASNNLDSGYYIEDSSYNNLTNNYAIDNYWEGFTLLRSSNNNLTGNTAEGHWYDGFLIVASTFNNITGNTARNNTIGFNIYYRWNNTFIDNIATDNGDGFSVSNCVNMTFIGNTATNNRDDGFFLGGPVELPGTCSNMTLVGNNASNNQDSGFVLFFASDNNLLVDNIATNNGGKGFWLDSSRYNNLSGNIAINNNMGFRMYNSSYNNLSDNIGIENDYGFYLLYMSRYNTMHSNEVINSTMETYYFDASSFGNDLTGSIASNYLRVEVLYYSGGPVQDAEVKIEVDGNPVYASPGFGGSNSTTDENGLTDWVLITFQNYVSDQTYVLNTTNVTVSYGQLAIWDNPRIVSMWTSHSAAFVVDDFYPTVTITTPSSDTQVNTGIIYINGNYNGTGSRITNITCNDIRFTLQTSPPFGQTGTYSFVNNTPIATGDFWIQITVTDQSNFTGTTLRHIIVDQDPPIVTITVPESDTTVNTGVVWINGSYDETGSSIIQISCNDWRFTLQTTPPFGVTGTYSFVNNTPIATSDFWIQITVTDQAGLPGTTLRHVIVDQDVPVVNITVPVGDTTVNTGLIWINGTYNGTGSTLQDIMINDSHFDLIAGTPFGVTGTYSFCNNTPIPTGEFGVRITVTDGANFIGIRERHLIVDQLLPLVFITIPINDTTVNTGVVWINGTFNGTGSQVMGISINDSRFTPVEPSGSPPYGITGTYSFRASFIGTSEFDVEVTIIDEAGLMAKATRHMIVEQPSALQPILFYLLLIPSGTSPTLYIILGFAAVGFVVAAVVFYYLRFRKV